MIQSAETQFAGFVATLGRGPGRSRALTRDEARTAFGMVLRNEADPLQVGAFLMLLRFRGEDAEEITGMVQAVRAHADLGGEGAGEAGDRPHGDQRQRDWRVDLDWPSYGAGRTRGAPWFLLAALALARSGVNVLMHGSNDFSSGISVEDGMAALGLQPAGDFARAAATLRANGFAYLPLRTMAPAVDRLLDMRRLFGLRSPVNTVARLLNPADALFGVDGVFHPPYIDVHLGVAERMGRRRLLVLKGGGGEAERVPLKPATAAIWDRETGRQEMLLPAVEGLRPHPPVTDTPAGFAAVWSGEATPHTPLATIQATIALALLAMGRTADPVAAMDRAAAIWAARR
jgi:anthranilate phosphoribosyltransferase